MTHEFKNIISTAYQYNSKGIKCVLATVVALDGSSYRKPGVQMLIAQDGKMTGAVSGGCVEKEVVLQAQQVFKSQVSKVMTYDGRYRLGCEGMLYILIEPFHIDKHTFKIFSEAFEQRKPFTITSAYLREEIQAHGMGSYVEFEDEPLITFSLNSETTSPSKMLTFCREMTPVFKLVIIGGEHDAVQLCAAASLMGWEVAVVASPKDPKTISHFPGAHKLYNIDAGGINEISFDDQTAIVLMNHNYAADLKFLLALKDLNPIYIGMIGAVSRREKLMHDLIEQHPEVSDEFLDKIYGPAGINIGAVTPQEIAVSILAEILSVIRNTRVFSLREKQGKIHH